MSFTRPVGEIFEHKGIKLMVVVSDGCEGCHFNSDDRSVSCNPYSKVMGFCSSIVREDRQEVIFVPVEEKKKSPMDEILGGVPAGGVIRTLAGDERPPMQVVGVVVIRDGIDHWARFVSVDDFGRVFQSEARPLLSTDEKGRKIWVKDQNSRWHEQIDPDRVEKSVLKELTFGLYICNTILSRIDIDQ